MTGTGGEEKTEAIQSIKEEEGMGEDEDFLSSSSTCMYKWPESNAETSEQLRRFGSDDDLTINLGCCSPRKKNLEGVMGRQSKDEEERVKRFSWLQLETSAKQVTFEYEEESEEDNEDDESDIQTSYSFEELPTSYVWGTVETSSTAEVEEEEREKKKGDKKEIIYTPRYRKTGGRGTGISPSVAFSFSSLSEDWGGGSSTPTSFFISSSSLLTQQNDNHNNNTERLYPNPLFYSKIYERIEEHENEGGIRRVKSNLESQRAKEIPEKEKKVTRKKVISLANLKKQKACPNIVHLLSREQKEKLEQDRLAKTLWGKATTLDRVKKEYKSLKGIP